MNSTEIKVPVLGESVVEATIARWLKAVGDSVKMDEIIAEIETDKVTLEITAPIAGVVSQINYQSGQTVRIGDIIGIVSASSAASPMSPPITQTPPNASVSSLNEIVMTTIANLEEIPSIPTAQSSSMLMAPQVTAQMMHDASPSVRKRLAENAFALQAQSSSLSPQNPSGASQTGQGGDVMPVGQTVLAQRLETRVPMSRLRQTIAQRLKEAQNTAAILTTFNEVDMTAIKELRERYKDKFEKKYGVKLGFMSFFIKACVKGLQEIPMLNSHIEGMEIITNNYCDIGVAVSGPNGLFVPVIRDVDLMDLSQIENAIAQFGQKAKDNKLTLEDMSGGTFSISNGGVFGSLLSTPILNPPQTGILGMHKIQERPVAINGRVEVRPMMYVALSYDHRLIDGREAVKFLVTLKEWLENPGCFLLGLS